jgi:hypothetical protein
MAALILFAAIFSERRIHFRPRLFSGYIGIPYPVNFLENRSSRLFLVLAYACFGTVVFKGLQDDSGAMRVQGRPALLFRFTSSTPGLLPC